jgi:hypothetical protein
MIMEAVRTSETSVDNYFTRQYIPEDKSEQNVRCLEVEKVTVKNGARGEAEQDRTAVDRSCSASKYRLIIKYLPQQKQRF